jgi:peptide-methionine (S)-S-oxide reductase
MPFTRSRRFSRILAACAALLLGALIVRSPLLRAEPAAIVPSPKVDNVKAAGPMQKAVIAGGCFWGMQGMFQHVRGVKKVLSGYAGGERATAQYETVSTGTTGHAESIEITFDPAQISYGQLLQIAFSVGFDPTELNRQGPDSGTQYRSDVFYADDTQKSIATAYIAQLNEAKAFPKPIVTRVDPLHGFFVAEDYHQDYLFLHPTQPYIAFNDIPKVENLKKVFPALYADKPMLVGAR